MCENVNLVHIFLALIEKTNTGRSMLKHMDTTFDMIYSSYQNLANAGKYGHLDTSNIQFDMDFFSTDALNLIGEATQNAVLNRQQATCDSLLDLLLDSESNEFLEFLNYIDITVEAIKNIKIKEFYIPEEIRAFVEDMNESESVINATYSDVAEYTNEMVEVLSRKLKANPCLVGEAGVGKTSIVNAFVKDIVNKNVPQQFVDTHVCYINSALLISGTRYRGDFEERMKALLEWASSTDVIIFLDEIHTFINLGKSGDSSSDTAGNMIKKYLSDGSIRIIGATTNKEFHKYIEGDTAFDRRLQKLIVKEPTPEKAIHMIKSSITDYETFHKVKVTEDSIELAVRLSDRYMKDKFLPDKAYTILDQACAKAKLAKVKKVRNEDILGVVSKITSINVNKLNESEQSQLLKLEETISDNLIGQKNAVKTVSRAIRRAKADIHENTKPLASFLFVGPTGVGKTELCKILSKEVAVGDMPLIKIDMSEYSEKSSVSKMLGSTPGYIGYGEGGQLTEKVKANPHSLILFDEIEKAHPEVFNVFLQLLDEGRLTDGEGQTVDFTNCIIVMTSNAGYGADGMNKQPLGFGGNAEAKSTRETEKIAMQALESTFKPEFLNRIDNLVIFEKLTKEQCKEITKLLLNKLTDRIKSNKNIDVTFDESVITRITDNGYSDKYGARNLKREIQDTVEDELSDAILSNKIYSGCKAVVKYENDNIVIDVTEKPKSAKMNKSTVHSKLNKKETVEA
jgi:ATP-dependent Clp protease ATP-binding subunit ClpC